MAQLSVKHRCWGAVVIFSGKTTSQETSYLEILTTAVNCLGTEKLQPYHTFFFFFKPRHVFVRMQANIILPQRPRNLVQPAIVMHLP